MKQLNCDCGHTFKEEDVVIVEPAGPDQYPYEGNMYLFCCDVCGGLTQFTEDEV